ncbi:MAG: hypothetical protein H0V44_13120 [Planctomycetes bacterium]|nr:hypothetical protein [Planctomycetota bacterium]
MNWAETLVIVGVSVTATLSVVGAIHLIARSRAGGGGLGGGGAGHASAPQMFTLQRARLTCDGGSVITVGQPCRIHFQWGIMNGARSLVIHRTKLLVQKDRGSFHPVASLPELDQPKAASYERSITGDISRVYAWDQPGVYYLKARVKAALAGTPFTYQFEVRGRVKVLPNQAFVDPGPAATAAAAQPVQSAQPAQAPAASVPPATDSLVLVDPNAHS